MSIKNRLIKIGVDKYLHFIVCLLISFITSKLINVFSTLLISLFAGFLFAVFIGVLKEVYDSYQQNNYFDKNDLKADIIGSIIGVLMSI